jgi:hypothetical protein
VKRLQLALPLLAVAVALLFGLMDARPTVAQEAAEEGPASGCIACHEKLNPGLVSQWRRSKHASAEPRRTECEDCHGSEHSTAEDAAKAKTPTPKTCKKCHFKQVRQFGKGKHAKAELAVTAIPMFGNQPQAVQDMGCVGCHSVGKTWEDGSVGKCDSCHTRHLFSAEEARKPEACETCHMGEDHSQYEMWRSSKHGVIHHVMPEEGRAPVCQTCHMQEGDHAVMTGWGFLGLRLPVPDERWQEDTMTIVKAIGPWGRDEKGMEERVGAIKALDLARLDDETFQEQRAKMLKVCAKCHTETFGKEHLERADAVIKETTHLMADAVRVVEKLYDDGVLPLTEDGPKHPDLLLFYDSPTEVEQELYKMFLFHRQKAFQGAIHVNPDYMHWYGWAPMKTSFQKIRKLAQELRDKHAK